MDEPREVWVVEGSTVGGNYIAIECRRSQALAENLATSEKRADEGLNIHDSAYRVRRYLPAESVREVLEAAKKVLDVPYGHDPLCRSLDGQIPRRQSRCDCGMDELNKRRVSALRLIEAKLKEQGA